LRTQTAKECSNRAYTVSLAERRLLNDDKKEKNMKHNAYIQLITAAVLAILGMVLLYCGLYIDPEGEIHETVLVAFGEALTFSGSIMGIDYRYKNHYKNDNSNPPTEPPDGKSGDGKNHPPLRGEGI
jgi:hypothetical protein